ncbi:MAG: HU family DNA-binding protein [Paraprevotella clara]|uniref:Integration host factor subunit alpha n=1 Tax=Paraprevotella clara TaxID=454154 RepID=A0A6N3GL82_9BACT
MDKKVLIQDLADGLVLRRGLPKKDADVFVRSVFEIIGEYLQTDKIVKVKGLGTFKLVTVDSRESVDVNTGERIVIKEYTKINFTPDPVLRDAVNKPFAQFETVVLYEGTDIADMERMDIPDLSEDHEAENISDVNEETDEADEMVLSESEEVLSGEEKDMQAKGHHGIDEVSIETAAIDETGAVEIQDGENENTDTEATVNSIEEYSDVVEEVENKAEAVSENVDEKSDTSVGDETEDERVSSLQQNAENEIKAESISAVQEEVLPEGKKEESHKNNSNVDVHHVEKVHVATQQIEVQKVEHQTVENQHIVQMAPEHHGRRRVYLTPWMMFFVVLLVLLLMAISYYIGYHHLFYGNQTKVVKQPVVVHPVPLKKDTVQISKEQDSLKVDSGSIRKVQVPEGIPEKTNKVKAQPEDTQKVFVEYPQVKNGAYEIVGTQEEHRMRSGETLRGLALRYYGSKDFTVYLVVYNKIANPDLVPEGMLLKIPKLRLKRR